MDAKRHKTAGATAPGRNQQEGAKPVHTDPAMQDASPAASRRMSARPEDETFMRMALEQARCAAAMGEVPIGAVVVHEGRVVGRAHNRRETDADPAAHAEFSAMLEAARALGRWRLTGCTVYVTLEPCLMCAGLMVNARIDRCVYGAPDPKGGAVGTLYDVSHDERLNHAFEVTAGVLRDECAETLRAFFRRRRQEARAARRQEPGAQGREDGGCRPASPDAAARDAVTN